MAMRFQIFDSFGEATFDSTNYVRGIGVMNRATRSGIGMLGTLSREAGLAGRTLGNLFSGLLIGGGAGAAFFTLATGIQLTATSFAESRKEAAEFRAEMDRIGDSVKTLTQVVGQGTLTQRIFARTARAPADIAALVSRSQTIRGSADQSDVATLQKRLAEIRTKLGATAPSAVGLLLGRADEQTKELRAEEQRIESHLNKIRQSTVAAQTDLDEAVRRTLGLINRESPRIQSEFARLFAQPLSQRRADQFDELAKSAQEYLQALNDIANILPQALGEEKFVGELKSAQELVEALQNRVKVDRELLQLDRQRAALKDRVSLIGLTPKELEVAQRQLQLQQTLEEAKRLGFGPAFLNEIRERFSRQNRPQQTSPAGVRTIDAAQGKTFLEQQLRGNDPATVAAQKSAMNTGQSAQGIKSLLSAFNDFMNIIRPLISTGLPSRFGP